MKSRDVKFTEGELAAAHRMRHHMNVGLIALCIPYFLGIIILASGNYLSETFSVDPDSIPFRLWPFNQIYLRQFASSRYTPSEVRWFFTVVSYANLAWLILLCWKFVFELIRKDVAFPTSKLVQFIVVRPLVGVCGGLLLSIFVFLGGFYMQGDSQWGLSLGQSITTGAFKLVLVLIPGLYILTAYVLEFGGLALRYLLARRANSFSANHH
jgi:hypothetical protein